MKHKMTPAEKKLLESIRARATATAERVRHIADWVERQAAGCDPELWAGHLDDLIVLAKRERAILAPLVEVADAIPPGAVP
jgi:hypothetical protein